MNGLFQPTAGSVSGGQPALTRHSLTRLVCDSASQSLTNSGSTAKIQFQREKSEDQTHTEPATGRAWLRDHGWFLPAPSCFSSLSAWRYAREHSRLCLCHSSFPMTTFYSQQIQNKERLKKTPRSVVRSRLTEVISLGRDKPWLQLTPDVSCVRVFYNPHDTFSPITGEKETGKNSTC